MKLQTSYLLFLFAVIASCAPEDNPGEKISKQYCSSCHLYPEPDLLPERAWHETLDAMSVFYGMPKEEQRYTIWDKSELAQNKIKISRKNWQKIKKYYYKNSPANIPVIDRPSKKMFDQLYTRKSPLCSEKVFDYLFKLP